MWRNREVGSNVQNGMFCLTHVTLVLFLLTKEATDVISDYNSFCEFYCCMCQFLLILICLMYYGVLYVDVTGLFTGPSLCFSV